MAIDAAILKQLEQQARIASENAHCPYSQFHVGAAVLAEDGSIYSGCNVENSAYHPTTCAESNALAAAVVAGKQQILAVMVYTPTKTPTFPCGNCRQILQELAPEATIYVICEAQPRVEIQLRDLLPHAFGQSNLALANLEPVT